MAADAKIKPLSRIVELLAPERRDLWAIALFAFCVAVLSLATPIAVEALVNTVAFSVLLQPVIILTLILFGCLGLAALIQAMSGFLIEYLHQRIFVRVASEFARRLPRVKLEAYDHRYGPEVLNRFFDVLNVQKSAASLLSDGVAIAVSTLVGMVVLAFYHPALLGFDIALLIGLSILVFGLGRGGVRTGLEESDSKYETAFWLQELARSPRTFKMYAGPELACERADGLVREYVRCRRAHFRIVWRQILFALALQVLASSALLGLGGWLVIRRELNLGQLVAAELIVTLIVSSFAKLGKEIASFYNLCVGVEKLGKVIALPLEPERGEAVAERPGGLAVEVHHGGVNWSLGAGEKVALVGSPGVGKSRLLDLICGLREAEYGRVRYDGIDLNDLRVDQCRRRVALVRFADVIAGTVLDNLRVGREEIDLGEIRVALDRVNLGREVHALPEGLNTPLLPSGSPLSRSQAVRLCVARAMLGRPRFLVLDGVLDGLNLQECPDLLDTLFAADAPWTLLAVTGRAEVIDRCGRTLEMTR